VGVMEVDWDLVEYFVVAEVLGMVLIFWIIVISHHNENQREYVEVVKV
jgi:hypothetical protein